VISPNVIGAKTMDIFDHTVTVNQDASAMDKISFMICAKKAKTYQLYVLYVEMATNQTIKDAQSINNLKNQEPQKS
jgi:hypothetical protein